MLKQPRQLFARFVVAYGVLVVIFTGLAWLIPDSWSVIALYATGAHLMLLSTLLLLPIALWVNRPRRSAFALTPAIALFFAFYGGQFIPSQPIASADEASLRVMTYNILFRDGDYQSSIDVILAADADIVAVQELDPTGAQILREALSTEYPYVAMDGNPNGFIGVGFLSRFPILESAYLLDTFGNQRVVIDVAGTPVVFYNMHASVPRGWVNNALGFDVSQRTSDVNRLLERVSQETERVIVLGDFNMTDMSDNYQAVTSVLVDTYRQVGWGMGWTHAGPLVARRSLFNLRILRIDYVFIKPEGLRPLDAMVWHDSGGSDHLPVLATIELSRVE